jgi:hypothetical protein
MSSQTMKQHKKILGVLLLLGAFVLILAQCINPAKSNDPRGKGYAGATTCRECHQAVYDSFINTAHFKATAEANPQNILGHFHAGENFFSYSSNEKVVMQKRDSGYYQALVIKGKETAAYRFDILFGNRNAQTSVYWQGDQLYELPLSHYNASNTWGTSPGFPAAYPEFRRLVDADCFDCHSSNIVQKNTPVNNDPAYEKRTIIYGIDCERCHGPARRHVNYHQQHPGEKTAAWLVRNSNLTAQQKLDACAVCHSGNDKMKIQSRFAFRMGDTLGYFFMPFGGSNASADVHGNQYALLTQSKCFNINTMTCGTCHDPHKDAAQSLATYSQKCMNCHTEASKNFCSRYASLGQIIKTNCIDCHMPKKASNAISYQTQQSSVKEPYLLRTHTIGVYKDSELNVHGTKKAPKTRSEVIL